jgi:DNA-binding NarL/FixJ family response regulator
LLQITTAVKSIFLIDDHIAFRKGLRMMLEVTPGLTVDGESSSRGDLAVLISEIKPDLLFIDVHLQNDTCFHLTARIHLMFPAMKIVWMSMFSEPGYREDALQAGASAVIFKPTIGDELDDLLSILYPGELEPGLKNR